MIPAPLQSIHIDSIAMPNRILYPSPFNRNSADETSDRETGRIGEKMVYEHLVNEYPNHLIIWKNQHVESGLPYDILLEINGKTQYIEVKSTRTYNQHIFPISINEIKYFLRNERNYVIYCVYVDGNRFKILNIIRSCVCNKRLDFCLRILPGPSDYNQILYNESLNY